MAGLAVRESVTVAGRAERARAARAFVSEVLGPGHPCGDVAVSLVSEIFGNCVLGAVAAAAKILINRDELGGQIPEWLRFRPMTQGSVKLAQVTLVPGRAGNDHRDPWRSRQGQVNAHAAALEIRQIISWRR